ncbi:polysaccharide lyase [uncultured Pontibacter sp.]|uniref:polysaccharide lyase n=1 Tax=uncultured Pontibacter sp. TaxID=453356 RepID=UPI00263A0673|nr:polysaccharide lyase [uncultured Pontibacter sp.]
MNLKLRYILTPMLVGAITFSCDKKDLEEVNPSLGVESVGNATASLLFSQNFEGSDPLASFHSRETGAAHSLTVVDRPGGGGKTSRFELRPNDPDVKGSRRVETTVVEASEVEKETWYGYDAYFPADGYVDEANDEVITQWHQSDMGSPSASLRTTNGRITMTVRNEQDQKEKIDLGPVTKNKWLNIVVHMVHSHGSDGLTEIWIDGKQVLSRKGGNLFDGALPKWKIGIYKSRWASEATTVDKRVLYFDNVRVGTAGTTLADMTSSTVTAPTVSEPELTPEPTPTAPTTDPQPGTSVTEGAGSVTLIDANADKDLFQLTDGSTVSFSAMGTKKLNFRANFDPATTANVKFELTGAKGHSSTDGAAPFALFGDNGNGNYYYNQILPAGSYTLKATPYSASGAAGTPVQVRFTIVESGSNSIAPSTGSEEKATTSPVTSPTVSNITLIDANADKDLFQLTDGSTVSFSAMGTKKLNFRANFDPATTANVKFELTGAKGHSYTDGAAPFALFGDNGSGNYYYNQILPAGSYTLKATPYSASGAAGTPMQVSFTIKS